MINLLPPEARRHVLTEYWLRVVSVWLLLLVVAGGLILVLLFPSYILLELQLQARQDTYQQVEVEQESFLSAQKDITRANQQAALLADTADMISYTSVLETIDLVRSPDISINQIVMSRTNGVLTQITLQGEAVTRDALAMFRNQIELQDLFANAELPLANLARDREVPFNITVTLADTDI